MSNKNEQVKEKWCNVQKCYTMNYWPGSQRQRGMSQSQAATLHLTRPHVPLVSPAPSAAEDNGGLSCQPPKSSAARLTDNTARRAAAAEWLNSSPLRWWFDSPRGSGLTSQAASPPVSRWYRSLGAFGYCQVSMSSHPLTPSWNRRPGSHSARCLHSAPHPSVSGSQSLGGETAHRYTHTQLGE